MKKSLLKNVLSVALAASVALSAAACSGDTSSDDSSDANTAVEESEAEETAEETTEETTEAEPATREISYETSNFIITMTVPEDSSYEFTTEAPSQSNWGSGECYLVGDDIIASIATFSLQGDPWDTSVDLWLANNEGSESTTFAGRDAVRLMNRMVGTDADGLYGYNYLIRIDDFKPGFYAKITVAVADWDPNSTETVFADPEVQAILNSIVISEL